MSNKPLVQASLAGDKIFIQVMPGVPDPILALMNVSRACVQAAEDLLVQERTPAIQTAPPGMRVARID